MTSDSNVAGGTPFAQPVAEPAAIPWWRLLYWSLRRELWENKAIYLAPLAVTPVALIGSVVAAARLPAKLRTATPKQLHDAIQAPFDVVAGLLMLTTLIVAVMYALDALYGERRDRSILFWKSLPVSDAITVVAKAIVPIVILPLISFTLTVVVQLATAMIGSAIFAASGAGAAELWQHSSLGHRWLLLLYHLVAVHGLAWAPFFGWMLLVSAWARRAPFVWAFLPLVAIGMAEKLAFNTTHFGAMIALRLSGSESVGTGHMLDPMMTHVTAGRFFGAAGFWIGLALTAVFLFAAARLRRSRIPD
jgi:ABC-2 type transport system permease protein